MRKQDAGLCPELTRAGGQLVIICSIGGRALLMLMLHQWENIIRKITCLYFICRALPPGRIKETNQATNVKSTERTRILILELDSRSSWRRIQISKIISSVSQTSLFHYHFNDFSICNVRDQNITFSQSHLEKNSLVFQNVSRP